MAFLYLLLAFVPVYVGGSIPASEQNTITPEQAQDELDLELKKQLIFVIGVCAGCIHGEGKSHGL
jgi:hypothetical protein